ncbi:hypothetical protein AVEN_268980-1, partial [Araneus ventricosus]
YYYQQLEEMVNSAPVDSLPERILNKVISFLKKNCTIFDEKDPVFLKELQEVKENYEEVMRAARNPIQRQVAILVCSNLALQICNKFDTTRVQA